MALTLGRLAPEMYNSYSTLGIIVSSTVTLISSPALLGVKNYDDNYHCDKYENDNNYFTVFNH